MKIIDYTYFESGKLLIEGINTSTPTGEANCEELAKYVDKYTKLYLVNLLGWHVASNFIEYVEHKEDDEGAETNELFDELLAALTSYLGIEKASPIANYVYFYYIRDNQQRATPLGVTAAYSENRVVDSAQKQSLAWNEMVTMNRNIAKGILCKIDWICTEPEMFETINTLGA